MKYTRLKQMRYVLWIAMVLFAYFALQGAVAWFSSRDKTQIFIGALDFYSFMVFAVICSIFANELRRLP